MIIAIPKTRDFWGFHTYLGREMLEGNISSLLGSFLNKVFEEESLTKENLRSDIYTGKELDACFKLL